jgi:hypothetical protein
MGMDELDPQLAGRPFKLRLGLLAPKKLVGRRVPRRPVSAVFINV